MGRDDRVLPKKTDENVLDWDKKEVAVAQFTLTQKELARNVMNVRPYRYFLQAMALIPGASLSLIDVGCGVGHYSALVKEFCPKVATYVGIDVSPHMIGIAKQAFPDQEFYMAKYQDIDLPEYDIVLCSGFIEVMKDGATAAVDICRRASRYIIFNKMRIHASEPSLSTRVTSYDNWHTWRWVFNEKDFDAILGKWCARSTKMDWGRGGLVTYVAVK